MEFELCISPSKRFELNFKQTFTIYHSDETKVETGNKVIFILCLHFEEDDFNKVMAIFKI